MSGLNLYSLNTRGLRQTKKRLAIFKFLKKKQNSIILLQETHSVPTDAQTWKKELGGEVLYSHGTFNSKGIAILLPQHLDITVQSTVADDMGRYLFAKINYDDNIFTVVNVYAPTKDKPVEQLDFFDSILPLLYNSDINTIVGGDFNICLNNIDKSGGRVEPPSSYASRIKTFLEEYDYVDVWRLMHPDTKRYTWRESSRHGLIQSRLDYWLIPQHMLYNVNNTDIMSSILSDHSMITLGLHLGNSNNRGRGFWKFNCQLLTDSEYVKRVTECINECNVKYKHTVDKGLIWDAVKMEVRGISISYSAYIAKQRKKTEEELYKKLNQMEAMLAHDPSIINKAKYNELKAELEDLHAIKIKGALLRAKADLIELNEKNTSYFLKLERKHGELKNIKCLESNDGMYITNPSKILEEEKTFYENLYSDKTEISDDDYRNSCQFFTNDNIIERTLGEADRKMCDTAISYDEIAQAVKTIAEQQISR